LKIAIPFVLISTGEPPSTDAKIAVVRQ